jgi:hypothetical protein
MLRSEAISIIKRGLGFRQTQDAAIIAALQEAQRIMELGHTLPEWLLVYDQAVTVTAGVPTITLPTGFIRMPDDFDLYYINSDSARVFIPRKNYTEAYQAYVASGDENDTPDGVDSTYPKVWVRRGKTAGLVIPTPTVSFTAYMTFYKAAATLDSDVENLWLANVPDLLIGMAGMTVAGNLRDNAAYAQFQQRANLAGRSHMGDIIEDELAGRGLIMGRDN